jgi:hypothetical protein
MNVSALLDVVVVVLQATYMEFNRVLQHAKCRLFHVVTYEQCTLPPPLRKEESDGEDEEEEVEGLEGGPGGEESGEGSGGEGELETLPSHSHSQFTTAGPAGGGLDPSRSPDSKAPSSSASSVSSSSTSSSDGGRDLHSYLSQPVTPSRSFEPMPPHYREQVLRDRHHHHEGGTGAVGGGARSLSHRRRASS